MKFIYLPSGNCYYTKKKENGTTLVHIFDRADHTITWKNCKSQKEVKDMLAQY